LAFRLGYRVGEWEHLQPAELWAMWDARNWVRSRDLEVVARVVAEIINRTFSDDSVKNTRELLDKFPGYDGGDDGD
jgi:hypothetical protein